MTVTIDDDNGDDDEDDHHHQIIIVVTYLDWSCRGCVDMMLSSLAF